MESDDANRVDEVKNVLITGAGRGIGAATARLAAAQGYGVAANYVHNEAAVSALVDEITAGGGRAVAILGDVASERDILAMFETTAARTRHHRRARNLRRRQRRRLARRRCAG